MARSDEFVLTAHWDFHEGSGTTLGDVVGSNHGTLVGGPSWLDLGGGEYALHFGDDGGERVTFPTKMLVANETSDPWAYIWYHWCVKIWFRTTVKSGRVLWQRNLLNEEDIEPCIWIGTDGILRALFRTSMYPDWNPYQVSSGVDVTDGKWHEVAVFQCEDEYGTDAGHLWLDKDYKGSIADVTQRNNEAQFWLAAGALANATWGQPLDYSDADNQTDGWSGDVKDIKVWWWNGATNACVVGSAAVDDLLEYVPPGPTVTNALMFSCNT